MVSLDGNIGHPFRFILIFPISTHSKDPASLLFVAHALVSDTFRSLVLPATIGIVPNVEILANTGIILPGTGQHMPVPDEYKLLPD